MSENNNVQLNETKLNHMKVAILKAEQRNLKTRELNEEAMADKIRRIIIDEVEKTY